jgi:glucose-6-phosphate dehydrogenase assembly protein OpcA
MAKDLMAAGDVVEQDVQGGARVSAPHGVDLGGLIIDSGPQKPGETVLRWSSRAHSIEEIDRELSRMWAIPKLVARVDGEESRHIAARTSVMNLVVVARRPEIGERCSATIQELTGRHPSRTLVVSTGDPDGPAWINAHVQAHCILPREDAPETCAEMIYLTAGGDAGRHLGAIVEPLLIHDLPVTMWWPGEPAFRMPLTAALLRITDRLVVDGASWGGDGLARVGEMAEAMDQMRLTVFDFALVRQSRWREAIASIFDMPECLPYVRGLRRISVTYGTHDPTGAPGSTNVVKPVYHVAWLASRLGLSTVKPLTPLPASGAGRPGAAARGPGGGRAGQEPMHRGLTATLREERRDVAVYIRPVMSGMPAGTTLRVELLAERRGSELRADVTAEAETVRVRVWEDGVELLERVFRAARRTDVDLLAEAIEAGGPDPVAIDAIRMASELATG